MYAYIIWFQVKINWNRCEFSRKISDPLPTLQITFKPNSSYNQAKAHF